MNQLIITADHEEYSVGLTGKFNVNGFTGFGEGWFNKKDVLSFCDNIYNLSKNMLGREQLIGAQQKANGSEYLELFSLRCYVLSKSSINGIIGVHVNLADYPSTDCREYEILKVSGEIKVRNHNLKQFSKNLQLLIHGEIKEAIIESDLDKL